MFWLDRVTQAVAPRWTLRRIRARAAVELVARHYEAAAAGRRTQGWKATSSDGNAASAQGLARLREVSRDLIRNNGYAENALGTILDHVVGWGITGAPVKASRDRERARAVWREWAGTTACDAEGLQDFAGLQRQVVRTVVESGECLVRRRWRRLSDGLPIPLQLQVLEPDYLDTTLDGVGLEGGGRIVQGVEFDAIGRRVAYRVFREHPGAQFTNARGYGVSDRIPASEILHVRRPARAGQVRGVPWFSSVTLRLKDFDEYEDAALVKQKIAACLAVITTDVDGTAPALGTTSAEEPDVDTLGPGMIMNAAPGRSVEVVQPPTVSEHAPYAQTQLRAIAAGMGVTYEDLTGDYCVAPETRVLRADLRWVRADELRVGDEIVAFDEDRPGKGQFRKHRQATVLRAGRRELARISVKTDRTAITVSTDHAFLCIRPTKGTGTKWKMHQWVRAEDLVAGDKILFLVDPWEDGTSHAHGYLKGIADGEGWVDRRRGSVGISQTPGPTFDEIGARLEALGFRATARRANGAGAVWQWDMNRMPEALRFLGEVRPERLLQRARLVYEGKAIAGGHGKRSIYATVLSAEAEGAGPVVTLETTTHTLITEGLYSHNTNLPFSAARMSRLRHWARVHGWRWNMIIPQFCDPVWAWAMEAAMIVGRVDGMVAAEWTPPPMPMIEPDKEGGAYQRLIRIGAMTWPEMVRERGYDPDQVLDEIAEWNAKFDAKKIVLDSDPRRMSLQGQPAQAPTAAAPPRPAEVDDEDRHHMPNGNGHPR